MEEFLLDDELVDALEVIGVGLDVEELLVLFFGIVLVLFAVLGLFSIFYESFPDVLVSLLDRGPSFELSVYGNA